MFFLVAFRFRRQGRQKDMGAMPLRLHFSSRMLWSIRIQTSSRFFLVLRHFRVLSVTVLIDIIYKPYWSAELFLWGDQCAWISIEFDWFLSTLKPPMLLGSQYRITVHKGGQNVMKKNGKKEVWISNFCS